MNLFLLEQYINRIKKEDINNFALKEGVSLEEYELDIIYNHVKKDYKTIIFGNARSILDEIKNEVKPFTYSKIENLYDRFKNRINFT